MHIGRVTLSRIRTKDSFILTSPFLSLHFFLFSFLFIFFLSFYCLILYLLAKLTSFLRFVTHCSKNFVKFGRNLVLLLLDFSDVLLHFFLSISLSSQLCGNLTLLLSHSCLLLSHSFLLLFLPFLLFSDPLHLFSSLFLLPSLSLLLFTQSPYVCSRLSFFSHSLLVCSLHSFHPFCQVSYLSFALVRHW